MPYPRRHGQVRALTTQQLNQLTQTDLNKLAEFAEHRMGGLSGRGTGRPLSAPLAH